MTDWRTPDTLLISRKPKPELGQLAIEILGPHHQDLARTPWRQRPVLAAIGLRRLANRSIDITDLCQAMSGKPEDALFALELLPGNALWKFIELLDAQNLYWGDISRIDTLISGSSMPPWARGLHQLDALIAKLIYDDADKTAAWSRLFKDGLSIDDTAMLYAWRKLEITSHGILRGPKPLAPLWSLLTDQVEIMGLCNDIRTATEAGDIGHDYITPLSGHFEQKAVLRRIELDEYRQWHPELPSDLDNQLLLGLCNIVILGKHPWRSWYRFEYSNQPEQPPTRLVDVIWENAGFKDEQGGHHAPDDVTAALTIVLDTIKKEALPGPDPELTSAYCGQVHKCKAGRSFILSVAGSDSTDSG